MAVFAIILLYIVLLVKYWKKLGARIPLLIIGCAVVFLVTWGCYKLHSEPDDEDKEKDSSQPDDLLPVTFTAPTARDFDNVTRDNGDDHMIMLPMPDEEETHNIVTADANVTEVDRRVPDNHVVDLVISNKDWWIDTGATRHVCFDRNLFVEYKEFEKDEDNIDLYMCNSKDEATSLKAMGEGKVVLKFTSGNEVTLNQVVYVPNTRKNLISGSMLSKEGFRMIAESNNLVLNKGELRYVGIALLTD